MQGLFSETIHAFALKIYTLARGHHRTLLDKSYNSRSIFGWIIPPFGLRKSGIYFACKAFSPKPYMLLHWKFTHSPEVITGLCWTSPITLDWILAELFPLLDLDNQVKDFMQCAIDVIYNWVKCADSRACCLRTALAS